MKSIRSKLDWLVNNVPRLQLNHLERAVLDRRVVRHHHVSIPARDKIFNRIFDCGVHAFGVVSGCLHNALHHGKAARCAPLELLFGEINSARLSKEDNSLREAHGIAPNLGVTASLVEAQCALDVRLALRHVRFPPEAAGLEISANLRGEQCLGEVTDR